MYTAALRLCCCCLKKHCEAEQKLERKERIPKEYLARYKGWARELNCYSAEACEGPDAGLGAMLASLRLGGHKGLSYAAQLTQSVVEDIGVDAVDEHGFRYRIGREVFVSFVVAVQALQAVVLRAELPSEDIQWERILPGGGRMEPMQLDPVPFETDEMGDAAEGVGEAEAVLEEDSAAGVLPLATTQEQGERAADDAIQTGEDAEVLPAVAAPEAPLAAPGESSSSEVSFLEGGGKSHAAAGTAGAGTAGEVEEAATSTDSEDGPTSEPDSEADLDDEAEDCVPGGGEKAGGVDQEEHAAGARPVMTLLSNPVWFHMDQASINKLDQ